MFRNKICFYGEELLAPHSTPKLKDHPLSAVRDCLFNIFLATHHTGGRSLHPQPEDAPCRGDRDPLITASSIIIQNVLTYLYYTVYFPNTGRLLTALPKGSSTRLTQLNTGLEELSRA